MHMHTSGPWAVETDDGIDHTVWQVNGPTRGRQADQQVRAAAADSGQVEHARASLLERADDCMVVPIFPPAVAAHARRLIGGSMTHSGFGLQRPRGPRPIQEHSAQNVRAQITRFPHPGQA